jgi:hypothetical protein
MKRLAAALCLVTGLAFASCSDEGDDVPVPTADAAAAKDGASSDLATADTGVSVDGADAANDAGQLVCKGLVANPITREKLAADVTTGKCMAPSDLDSICSNDVIDYTTKCGAFSYIALKGDAGADFMVNEEALRTSTLMCVKTLLAKAPVSDDCLSCYGQAVACTLSHCGNVCLPDPSNPACRPCQISAGCGSMLYACSGLPMPPSMADGGAGDGGGVDAGAIDAPAADASSVD